MTPEKESKDQDSYAETARQRAVEAYESARDGMSQAGRKAADTLTEAPLLALAGGLAAGALIAALLPKTESEARLIGPTARRVKDSARAAMDAARETGGQRLGKLGLSRDKGEETLRTLLQGVGDAVRASAEAAAGAVRDKR